jgi:hypothetical protein
MSNQTKGRSLELYFIDGRPDGMLTAEVFNWTGHLLMAPRTQISAALARKEARYTGVYLLIGERDGLPLAYIGEAEDISARIRNHDGLKDWWTIAVLVTSAANNLNKAHVRYLEARLVEEARALGVSLENGTTPARPSLSEAAQANMEAFLEYLLMVLPALRVDVFISNKRPSTGTGPGAGGSTNPVFELSARKHGIVATAVLEGGEFIVQAGSQARPSWTGPITHSYAQAHADLMRSGVLESRGAHCVFTTNYAFRSPSAAAAAVNGRSSNGTLDWRLKTTGQTYKDWEADQLAKASGESV